MDETYRRFVLDTSKVREAQQGLTRAWEDLYHKLTATYSDDVHRDGAVTGVWRSKLCVGLGLEIYQGFISLDGI